MKSQHKLQGLCSVTFINFADIQFRVKVCSYSKFLFLYRMLKTNQLTTSASVTSTKSTTTALNDDVESNSSSSIRRRNRLNFNNMLMLMVDDKQKEKYCYDSLDEGSEGSVRTSKTSSTNDTCDGFKSMYSAIVPTKSKQDQNHIPLSLFNLRSSNQNSTGKYQHFVRQNAFQTSPQNIRKEKARSLVCEDVRIVSATLPQAAQDVMNTQPTDAEKSALLQDDTSEIAISDQLASVAVGLDKSTHSELSTSLLRNRDMRCQTNLKNHRAPFNGRG